MSGYGMILQKDQVEVSKCILPDNIFGRLRRSLHRQIPPPLQPMLHNLIRRQSFMIIRIIPLRRNPFSTSRLLLRSSSFYWFLTFMCHNYLSSLPVLYPTLFFNIFFHYTPIFFHVYEESMKLSLMNCSIILKLHQAPS